MTQDGNTTCQGPAAASPQPPTMSAQKSRWRPVIYEHMLAARAPHAHSTGQGPRLRVRTRPEAPTSLPGWGHRRRAALCLPPQQGQRGGGLSHHLPKTNTPSPPSGPGLETFFPGRLSSSTLGRHTLGKVRGHGWSQRPLDGLGNLSGVAPAESKLEGATPGVQSPRLWLIGRQRSLCRHGDASFSE